MILGSNEDALIWKNNIFNAIKDLSDIDTQKLAWSGKHSIYISSFSEILGVLYDDFDIERYIAYYKSIFQSNNLHTLLCQLDEMIKEYKETGYGIEIKAQGHEIILKDPKWIEITEKAKEIISQWNK
jgi:hypothetical protein